MNKLTRKLLSGLLSVSMLLAAIPAVVSADEPADSLLFNATFDEAGTGTGSFAATAGGTVTEKGAVSYVESFEGNKALKIETNAAGNYLELPKGILNGKTAATFSFMLKPASGWPFMTTPVASQTYLSEKYLGMLATDTTLTAERYNNSGTRLSSVIANGDYSTWQYITVVFEANGTKLYVNGSLAKSDTAAVDISALFTADASTWIGHGNWGDGEGFAGSVDNFSIYGKALSEAEITTLAADAEEYRQQAVVAEYNSLKLDTHFYQGDTEIYSYLDPNAPDPVDFPYLTEAPAYADGKAQFTLYNLTEGNSSELDAYVAEFDANGLVKVVKKSLAEDAAASGGTLDVSIPFEKKNADDDVKVLVWDDMEPVVIYNPPAPEDPQKVLPLTVKTNVTNYTGIDSSISIMLSYVDADGQSHSVDVSDSVDIASLESNEITMTIDDSSSLIPSTAKKLTVAAVINNDEDIYDDAAVLYCGVKSPVTAPADSGTTTDGAHDPSIVRFPNDDTYYVYSSHHLIFTSKDLINWTKYDFTNINASAISPKTNAFINGNYSNTTMNGTYWAPDVIYREGDDHPYWMYISLSCGLGYRNSAIALEKSNSPLFWADKDADIIDAGVVFATKENSNYKTNAIDANIYTDSNTGKQYFVWGSFWGGIQAAPLTAEGIDYTSDATILSSCRNFGTSIFTQRGGRVGPEGGWMIEHDGSRYAFVSYGWLGSNYNTRVAKSALTTEFRTSNGWNLTDANGVTMHNQQSSGSYSNPTGYKMIGSYRLGDGSRTITKRSDDNFEVSSGADDAMVYYGPGHNSAITAPNGETFYVSHTRKNAVEIAATLQIRKMLWTPDGWPVVSPVTYAGEIEQPLPKDMIVGIYDLASVGQTKMSGSQVDTTNRNYDLPVLSSKIILGDDGTMTDIDGNRIGTWEFDGSHTVTLKFTEDGDTSNNKDEFYKNGDVMTLYALFGYDKDERTPVIGLTGVDQNHITQLAKKALSNERSITPSPSEDPSYEPAVIEKSAGGNPILGFDGDGNTLYAGDPAAFVDGDTVYIIAGHDTSSTEGYQMPNWVAYSSKDMKTWKYEGIAMEESSISWVNDKVSAWASQAIKHGDKYYLYYCAETKHGSGANQYSGKSIGVAVADAPTGPYVDSGKPLILGSFTPDSSAWNDIDPTVWVETVNGVEHRYLCWGNSKLFICELNEDMISVKDIDGDGNITFGKDVIEQTVANTPAQFTEAPWIYRQQDENGNYTGKYYLFYAMGWREQMAYAVADTLTNADGTLNPTWQYGGLLMPPTATSNTNHPAVIDFKGHTYFIYHNGSLPWGSGFRRSVCVEEFSINEDGTIDPIQETSTGLTGTKSYIYNDDGFVNYGSFVNSGSDDSYPISTPMYVGGGITDITDAQWEIVPGKADESNEYYVSIQAVNKPGLYICADPAKDSDPVTLTQDSKRNDTQTKDKMTFKTIAGENGSVKFESIVQPGSYLASSPNGALVLSSVGTSFQISDTAPEIECLASIENAWYADGKVHFDLLNAAVYGKVDIQIFEQSGEDNAEKEITASVEADSLNVRAEIPYERKNNDAQMFILAYFGDTGVAALPVEITQFENPYKMPEGVTSYFEFEDNLKDTKGAVADGTVAPTNIEGSTTASASYAEGYKGKAVSFSGAGGTGVNLGKVITNSKYTVAFRMKSNAFTQHTSGIFINSGTKSSQSWVSAPFGTMTGGNTMIWSYASGYVTLDSNGTMSTDTWHHITIAADGDTASLYIDGVKTGSGSIANIVTSTTDTYLGVNFWDTPFNGLIDDLYIYNGTTLTDEQIASLYEVTN